MLSLARSQTPAATVPDSTRCETAAQFLPATMLTAPPRLLPGFRSAFRSLTAFQSLAKPPAARLADAPLPPASPAATMTAVLCPLPQLLTPEPPSSEFQLRLPVEWSHPEAC